MCKNSFSERDFSIIAFAFKSMIDFLACFMSTCVELWIFQNLPDGSIFEHVFAPIVILMVLRLCGCLCTTALSHLCVCLRSFMAGCVVLQLCWCCVGVRSGVVCACVCMCCQPRLSHVSHTALSHVVLSSLSVSWLVVSLSSCLSLLSHIP